MRADDEVSAKHDRQTDENAEQLYAYVDRQDMKHTIISLLHKHGVGGFHILHCIKQ